MEPPNEKGKTNEVLAKKAGIGKSEAKRNANQLNAKLGRKTNSPNLEESSVNGETAEILRKKAGIGKNKVSPIGEKLDAHDKLAKMAGVGKGSIGRHVIGKKLRHIQRT